MYKQKRVLGIIPARIGSKRVSKKNIKPLAGKPLIAYAIEAGLKARNIDRLIVSTDGKEIAKIARKNKAEVPFMRSSSLAEDTTPDHPVLVHALQWLKENEGYRPDIVVMLRPTSPFKTSEMIDEAVDILLENPRYTSVRTISRAEGVFHPYWMFKKKRGVLSSFIRGVDITKYYQRQRLPECFCINGVVDVLRSEIILNQKNLYGDKVGFLEIDKYHSIDIDDEFDFNFCEFLIKRGHKKIR